jgi:hypothetical protein
MLILFRLMLNCGAMPACIKKISRQDAHYVVTEYGIEDLFGKL